MSVYKRIKSGNILEYRDAIVCLREWGIRGRLPIAIEATADILEAFLCDPCYLESANSLSQKSLALIYGKILARFVNLVVDLGQKGAVAASMEAVGGSVGLPNWVIQLRHSVSHGADYPGINILRRGVVELFQTCILTRYWDAQAALLGVPRGEPAVRFSSPTVFSQETLITFFSDPKSKIDLDHRFNRTELSMIFHWVATNLGRVNPLENSREGSRFIELYDGLQGYESRRDLIRECVRYGNIAVLRFLLREARSCAEARDVILEESESDPDFTYSVLMGSSAQPVAREEIETNSLHPTMSYHKTNTPEEFLAACGGDSFTKNGGFLRPAISLW